MKDRDGAQAAIDALNGIVSMSVIAVDHLGRH